MKTKSYTVMTVREAERLLAKALGVRTYPTLVSDMVEQNAEWAVGGLHEFQVTGRDRVGNDAGFLREVRERGRVEWNWEILAAFNRLCLDGQLARGAYLIEVPA